MCGVGVLSWVQMFVHTHAKTSLGIVRLGWPDGRSYLEQSNITVEVFDVVRDQTVKDMAEADKRRRWGRGIW